MIEYRGKRMTWDEACEQPASDESDPYHTFLFSLDDGRVIDAAIGGNAARWINHSCAPNCETYEDDRGRVYVAARRKIRPGEELSQRLPAPRSKARWASACARPTPAAAARAAAAARCSPDAARGARRAPGPRPPAGSCAGAIDALDRVHNYNKIA